MALRSRATYTIAGLGLVLSLSLGCSSDIEQGLESANDLLYQHQYIDAERLYRKILQQLESNRPLEPSGDAQRLLVLERLGRINSLYLRDYTKAIEDYRELVTHYSKSDEAFAARITVADIYHHKLGKPQAALDELQKLVVQFPDRPRTRWAQLQVITIYLQLKNYEQARMEAEMLVRKWSTSDEARQAQFLIANSYFVQSRYTEAMATYTRLLENSPDPEFASLINFEIANCLQGLGEDTKALEYYYACLADHPNPLLVQRKIKKVRSRVHSVHKPKSIHRTPKARSRRASTPPASKSLTKSSLSKPVPVVKASPTKKAVVKKVETQPAQKKQEKPKQPPAPAAPAEPSQPTP